MTETANPTARRAPKHCVTCWSVHEPCVCGRCHSGTPPMDPYCESCAHHHPSGDEHCPNCGQPASNGFHAAANLDDCPVWVAGGGWVPVADLTAAGRGR